ncbi:uncharacterized protein LOC110846176 [Folsomia candida]|uniref:ER-bound oxygenase mpaB/mpaB'/Rubber oxygenase catalytic domain-containing protein n=1 Tax=Folsomia candida TaxID=158441 RepID=A0A226EL22_FOLCA|nr:uncharacterized protein LOC110846176 [Folsomia candida]OXA57694.1 hypothetical protein Fcan01_06400 [Folsomia candida]
MPPNTHSTPTKSSPKKVGRTTHSKFFQELLQEGSVTDGNSPTLIEPHEIPWIDYDLLAKGREFVKQNYAVVLTTMMLADTIGFISKQIASTVFKSFYPNNICGGRFLSTFRTTMCQWLLSDFSSGANSEFVQAIQRVRKLHKILGRPAVKPIVPPEGIQYPAEYKELLACIREDMKSVDTTDYPSHLISWTPSMYFTQLDVTLVAFGMYAPFIVYPNKVGLYTTFQEDEGLRGYVHIWAVIGKMLGVQDRYNLALHPDRDLYMEIVTKLGKPGLKMADESVIFSIEKMIEGLVNTTIPYSLTAKSLIFQAMELADIKGEKVWGMMNWHDKWTYYNSKVSIYCMRFSLVRISANFFVWGMLTLYIKLFFKVHKGK